MSTLILKFIKRLPVDEQYLSGYCLAVISLKNSIVIAGLKHCGKSSAGRILASSFSVPFFDTDDLLEEIYSLKNSQRLSARDIYRKGKDVFQAYELRAAEKAVEEGSGQNIICSAGGGLSDNKPALKKFSDYFIFIYIYETPEILFERIIKNGVPAFLSPDKPFEDFKRIYVTRDAIYDKISDIKITAEGKSVPEICSLITKRLTEEGYAG